MTEIKITKKQLEILKLLYKFRFLDRSQIQSLLHHQTPRRIKAWCKDLTDKKCTGRHYSKKLKENTKPAIYYLASKSIKILKLDDEKHLRRIYKEHLLSKRMIKHCLRLADIYIQLLSKFDSFCFYTKTELLDLDYLPEKKPDAYVSIKDKTTKRYFLEIIDKDTPRFVWRSLVKKYIDYYQDNLWQRTTKKPFPKIFLICMDKKAKNYLAKFIKRIMDEEPGCQVSFNLCLKNIFKWENPVAD